MFHHSCTGLLPVKPELNIYKRYVNNNWFNADWICLILHCPMIIVYICNCYRNNTTCGYRFYLQRKQQCCLNTKIKSVYIHIKYLIFLCVFHFFAYKIIFLWVSSKPCQQKIIFWHQWNTMSEKYTNSNNLHAASYIVLLTICNGQYTTVQ